MKTLPVPTAWNSTLLASFPQELVALDFAECASELASLFTRQTGPACGAILENIIQHTAKDCTLCPQAHIWLRAKYAFFTQNTADFLQEALIILAGGRGTTPLLWYATIVDLIVFASEAHWPEVDQIKQIIAEDAQGWAWQHMPRTWKTLFEQIGIYLHKT